MTKRALFSLRASASVSMKGDENRMEMEGAPVRRRRASAMRGEEVRKCVVRYLARR